MKPLGLTSTLQVVRSSPAEDAIWRAAEEAICAGMTPKQVIRELYCAWSQHLADKKDNQLKEFGL